jgi:hypothetical protein
MPFFHTAKIEIANATQPIPNLAWQIKTTPLSLPPNQLSYLHATYRDHPTPKLGEDLVLLDTRNEEGQPDWTGSFIGTTFIFSHAANLGTLEGDPRFFFDDSQTPQAQGTGTEEWGGGGDYWGGQNMTLAFAGHPTGARNPQTALNEEDKIESAYRFLLADLMPFGKNAIIHLEHGGTNESTQHYETVAFWYGLPGASLVQTDTLKVGDPTDEHHHHYKSPQASAPYTITSRYELGPDTIHNQPIYPEQTDAARKTTGTSDFTLKIDKNNQGVLLRRKLDYAFPNQRAEVSIELNHTWQPAGIWYLAGSNTVVFSDPKQELGPTEHKVETSNRRFRDDELLLPLGLTQHRKSLHIRLKFTPLNRPLYPGYPVGEQAWSEIRYTAYSFVQPTGKW